MRAVHVSSCNTSSVSRSPSMAVRNAIPGGTATNADVDSAFRNRISTSPGVLKFGAAYFPYLTTQLNFVTADTHIRIASHGVITIASDGSESSTSGNIAAGTLP